MRRRPEAGLRHEERVGRSVGDEAGLCKGLEHIQVARVDGKRRHRGELRQLGGWRREDGLGLELWRGVARRLGGRAADCSTASAWQLTTRTRTSRSGTERCA